MFPSSFVMSEMPIDSQSDEAGADDIEVIKPEDIIIAILGTTGAGKSSFIASCTKDRLPRVGHGLWSCTTKVSVHTMQMLGRKVHLIDTPGFNDTLRSDGETFQELAYWLAAADDRRLQLSGIIFLHRITDIRFHRSTRRALEVFKAICGKDAFCGTVVATTMWNRVAIGEIEKAQDRQTQLKNKIQEDVLAFGGRLIPISAAEVDPHKIVRHIVRKDLRLKLAFQKELRRSNCQLCQTTAGRIVYDSLLLSFESMRTSTHGPTREMVAALASLRATRAEAQVEWEKRIELENEDFEKLIRKCHDIPRLEDCEISSSPSMQPLTTLERSSEPSCSLTATESSVVSTAYTDLETELELLKSQYEAMRFRQHHKLDRRRYWAHGPGTTTLGVVGTGLAVGQLVAAAACNVM